MLPVSADIALVANTYIPRLAAACSQEAIEHTQRQPPYAALPGPRTYMGGAFARPPRSVANMSGVLQRCFTSR